MTRSLFSILTFIMLSCFIFKKAEAYPTMIKHGYTTCVTCHFSPSGAGALTNYGKFIAGELFGRWNDSSNALKWLRNPTIEDKFEKKFFSQNIDWILGMQGRAVQSYFDTPVFKKGQPRLMQFDVEAGFSLDEYFGIIQFGARGAAAIPGVQKESDIAVRQFYLGARDITYAFRVGKFFPEYGIRYPNHNIPTRMGLFFNHNEEPNLIQYSKFYDTMDFNIGYLEGNSGTTLADKKGTVATATFRTGQTRSGISRLDANGDGGGYEATSIFTAIGYEEHGYTLAEYAVKITKRDGQANNDTRLAFLESGWEVTKGFIPFFQYQLTENRSSNSQSHAVPVGFKFYPFTHFELQMEYGKKFKSSSAGVKSQEDYALGMFHVYF